jgi:TRAP transporter TAXI family solute receptor
MQHPGRHMKRARTTGRRLADALSAAFLLCAAAACRTAPAPAPVQTILIASGQAGGVFYPLGQALARIYSAGIPGVRALAEPTVGSVFNVRQVQLGKADLAFTQSDIAYLSYQQPSDAAAAPKHKLRGIAVLNVNILHILGRGAVVRSVEDLRGRHVGLGAAGSGTEVAARIVVEGHRLQYGDLKAEFLPFSDVASRLRDGTLDAGFVAVSYPAAAITAATASPDVHLVPITREVMQRIRGQYPFLKPTVIPSHTYAGQNTDIETVGVDNLLVCREDLSEELVYQLTKAFFAALPELARVHAAAMLIDPEQALATPIPLHAGAARYYREREILQ